MFSWLELLISFSGGIFGAAFGALPAFILCGLAATLGATACMVSGKNDFTLLITWGPLLGPHVSFAGGAAAAVYASRKGVLANGRNITEGLMGLNSPDTLAIGGLFGSVGFLFMVLFNQIPDIAGLPWTNTIALSVTVNLLLARLLFGKTGIFGKVAPGRSRWIPTSTSCWLPYQSHPAQLLLIGLGVGLPSAFILSQKPELMFLLFGLTTFSLIFLQYGTQIPVTHHIALSASLLAGATGNIWWGITMAILAAYLAEFFACLFLIHGDSHIDPPTWALLVVFSLHPWLKAANILDYHPAIAPVALLIVAVSGFVVLSWLRSPIIFKSIPETTYS